MNNNVVHVHRIESFTSRLRRFIEDNDRLLFVILQVLSFVCISMTSAIHVQQIIV